MIFILRVFSTLSSHSCVYTWKCHCFATAIIHSTARYDATVCIYGTQCRYRVQPPAIYGRVKSNNNKYFGVKYSPIVHSLWTLPACLTCLSDKIIVYLMSYRRFSCYLLLELVAIIVGIGHD